MSATNHTVTVELSQYVSTDKPTYLTDYNGDMLKIDNAIAADRDSISGVSTVANRADGKADTNKTNIDALNVQLNGDPEDPSDIGIAGDLNAVEGTVNTVTSLIGTGSPTTSEQTIIGAINGLEGAIAPREDAANLANSYSVGEQFARGGSVYEALTSLTAGTAFASLVLNTDYKVADTLVEQIANAGGAELPDGYYLKEAAHKISYTNDESVTNAAHSYQLALAVLSYAQALANDEFIVLRYYESSTTKYNIVNEKLTNASTELKLSFGYIDGMVVSGSNWSRTDSWRDISSVNQVQNHQYAISSSQSSTNASDNSSNSVAANTTRSIYVDVYKKF